MLRAARGRKFQLLDSVRLLPAASHARTFRTNVEQGLKEDLLKASLAHVPKLVRNLSAMCTPLPAAMVTRTMLAVGNTEVITTNLYRAGRTRLLLPVPAISALA